MAELHRNSIELIKNVDGDKVEMERFWTPPFTPTKVTKEALGIMAKYEELEKNDGFSTQIMLDMTDSMAEFIANRLYDKQFTKEELDERYHGPSAFQDYKEQIQFAAIGMQTSSTKVFLKSKR